jgi:CheY-like chemotaxis protein
MHGGAKHARTGLNRNAQFTAGVRFVVALILVVDDEPSIRSVACQVLEDVGYSTVAATSANEAREVLSLTHPDLMILDLRLPDASGLELALQIQPSYPRLPVLFISGHPDDFPREGISEWPIRHGFLPKPYTVPRLLDSVRALLNPPPQEAARRGS